MPAKAPKIDRLRIRMAVRKDPYNGHFAKSIIEALCKIFKRAKNETSHTWSIDLIGSEVSVSVHEIYEIKKHVMRLFDEEGNFCPRSAATSVVVPKSHFLRNPRFILEEVLPIFANRECWTDFLQEAGVSYLPGMENKDVPPLDRIGRRMSEVIAAAMASVVKKDYQMVGYRRGWSADMDPDDLNKKLNSIIMTLSEHYPLDNLLDIIFKYYKKPEEAPKEPQCSIDLGDLHIRSFDDLRKRENRKMVIKALLRMTMDIFEVQEAEAELMAEKMA